MAATSVSGMLTALQSEWDALMLETLALRQSLDAARSELSQAQYQHDAACRVIARLTKERDAARASLAAAQAALAQRGVAAAAAGSASGDGGDVEMAGTSAEAAAPAEPAGITEAMLTVMKDKHKELTKARKKRVVAAETAPAEHVSALAVVATFSPHSASQPGITALDVHPSPARAGALVLTGGADKLGLLYDREQGKVLARLTGHARRVSAVAFHPDRDVLLTGSHDATVKLWKNSATASGGYEYAAAATLRAHTKEVTGVSVHPTGDFAVSGGRDGAWAFQDLNAGRMVAVVGGGAEASPFDAIRWHPDGLLVAAATEAGAVVVYDVRSQAQVASLEGHTGPATGLAVSENGYHLVSCSADATVRLWDLRKLDNPQTLRTPAALTCVAYDHSGNFLAAGSQDGGVAVWRTSDWSELFHAAGGAVHTAAVSGMAFTPFARELVTASLDRSLKVLAAASQ